MILRQLVPVCFEISEKTQTNPHQHNPLTFLGPGPPPHHRATLHMETAYRNAHKLRLLCEIIIQYCRTNPANASSSQSSETFELMTFSLLPVLTMKLCAVDFTFLSDFFKSEIPLLCTSAAAKKQILRRSFGVVAGKRASVALKVKVVQVRECIRVIFLVIFYMTKFFHVEPLVIFDLFPISSPCVYLTPYLNFGIPCHHFILVL